MFFLLNLLKYRNKVFVLWLPTSGRHKRRRWNLAPPTFPGFLLSRLPYRLGIRFWQNSSRPVQFVSLNSSQLLLIFKSVPCAAARRRVSPPSRRLLYHFTSVALPVEFPSSPSEQRQDSRPSKRTRCAVLIWGVCASVDALARARSTPPKSLVHCTDQITDNRATLSPRTISTRQHRAAELRVGELKECF